ncbi:MAG: TetR/AcrR family transcriptional regulator [Petrimonas sp.]|nr:TetR/AcrR family transcriptional regulator [Petrimonas sp.]
MDIKNRIVKQAGNLYYQYGIKNTSMDELASSLGISKRTIYENFKDKEEILLYYLKQLRDERNTAFQEFLQESDNIIEFFIRIIELHQSIPYANVKFYEDIYKYYPKIYALILEDNKQNNIFLKEFLQEGITQGFIRNDLNVDVTAFLVEESTFVYIRASYLEKPPFSFPELFFSMTTSFLRGISTDKGIKIMDDYLKKINKDKN